MTTSSSSLDMRVVFFMLGCCILLMGCGSETNDADQVSLAYNESPINELLGIDIAMRAGDVVELERAAERGVVECMKAVGFEYVAVDFASQFEPESGAEDPDSRNYAELNGYGISIRPSFTAPSPDELIDPNEDLRAQLSESELKAYQLALYGDAPLDGEPVPADERTGCVAEAYDAVYAAQAELGNVERFFGQFGAELSELEARFQSDPRFVELEATWAACMAEEGIPVTVRQEIFVELDRRMSEVLPLMTPGEEPSAEAQAAMDEVSDWERSAAVADWDCTQPVQDDMAILRYGYEALFLAENEDQIGSYE